MADKTGGVGGDVRGPGQPSVSGRTQQSIANHISQQINTLEALAEKPLRVGTVKFQGIERTHEGVLANALEELTRGKTFTEVQDCVANTYLRLNELGIFDQINIQMDESHEGSTDLCDVIVTVIEKPVLGLRVGTYVQGAGGSAEATGSIKNYFGRAETIELRLDGFKERYELSNFNLTNLPGGLSLDLKLTVPRFLGGDATLQTDIYKNQHNLERWSSYLEQRTGISTGLTWGSLAAGLVTASYSLSWQELSRSRGGWLQLGRPTTGNRPASRHVQRQMGNFLKSAVSLDCAKATFNDPFFPTSGYGLRSGSEVAGLWPDKLALRFGKQKLSGEWVTSLGSSDMVLALQGNANFMLPWGQKWWNRNTTINERFDAGGVTTGSRGFFHKGIGDTESRPVGHSNESTSFNGEGESHRGYDYLGGDVQADLTAALRIRNLGISLLDNNGIYCQAFVGCCNNQLAAGQGRSPRQIAERFRDNFRISGGLSLVWPTSIAKFELGYAHVRRASTQPRDGWRNGPFFGCSVKLW